MLISTNERTRNKEKINFISYADDFVITAASEEVLNKKVMPIVKVFLVERGLTLSEEKTRITHITQGFDFLGFNIRKYNNGRVFTKPSKENIRNFLYEIKQVVKANIPLVTDKLIHLLNPKITGWCNYYRNVVSSKIFSYIDSRIYKLLDSWAHHRHSNKGKRWRVKKYFTRCRLSNWRFYAEVKDKSGDKTLLYLKRASDTKIRRHIKIHGCATPFNPEFEEYFNLRESRGKPYKARSLSGG